MSKKSDIIDIGEISPQAACDKGFELQIEYRGEPIPVFITVTGKDGTAYKAKFREMQNERLRKDFEQERGGKPEEPPKVEDIEGGAAELLAACTSGWRSGEQPIIRMNGEDLEFSQSNAAKIYAEQEWIRRQVDAAVHDLGNFMQD